MLSIDYASCHFLFWRRYIRRTFGQIVLRLLIRIFHHTWHRIQKTNPKLFNELIHVVYLPLRSTNAIPTSNPCSGLAPHDPEQLVTHSPKKDVSAVDPIISSDRSFFVGLITFRKCHPTSNRNQLRIKLQKTIPRRLKLCTANSSRVHNNGS